MTYYGIKWHIPRQIWILPSKQGQQRSSTQCRIIENIPEDSGSVRDSSDEEYVSKDPPFYAFVAWCPHAWKV